MKKWRWFTVMLVVIVADQASKYWASMALIPYQPEPLMPMVNLTLAYNSGAAFSFLDTGSVWHRWLLTSFSAIMSIVLFVWIIRLSSKASLQLLAFNLILGGAIANLIDRAMSGYVVDFIDLYVNNHHWPDFNLADSAICVGAFLLFIDVFVTGRAEKQ